MEESQYFYVCDGEVLKSVEDLAGSLEHQMSDDTFRYHCNTEKNDFANWVSEIIGDKKLSKTIAKAKSKEAMLNKLKKKK